MLVGGTKPLRQGSLFIKDNEEMESHSKSKRHPRQQHRSKKQGLSQQDADDGEIHRISDKAIRAFGDKNNWRIPNGWSSPSRKREIPQASKVQNCPASDQKSTQKAKGQRYRSQGNPVC